MAYEQSAFDEAAFNFLLLAEAGHEVTNNTNQHFFLGAPLGPPKGPYRPAEEEQLMRIEVMQRATA